MARISAGEKMESGQCESRDFSLIYDPFSARQHYPCQTRTQYTVVITTTRTASDIVNARLRLGFS